MEILGSVLLAAAADSVRILLFFLGPVLLAAFLMYLVSSFVMRAAGKSIGLKAFVWLTAPGIIVHELGHALFCLIFRHEIREIRLFNPQPDGTLGSVSHAWSKGSFYQSVGNFFIGTGPIWFGCGVVYLLSLALLDGEFLRLAVNTVVLPADLATPGAVGSLVLEFLMHVRAMLGGLLEPALYSDWKFWLFMYLALCIGLHMSLSPADMKGSWVGFLLLVGLVLVLNLVIVGIVAAYPESGVAARAAGVTASLVQFSLAVAGVLLYTVTPAFILMLVSGVPILLLRSSGK